jgi:hypothetical protein
MTLVSLTRINVSSVLSPSSKVDREESQTQLFRSSWDSSLPRRISRKLGVEVGGLPALLGHTAYSPQPRGQIAPPRSRISSTENRSSHQRRIASVARGASLSPPQPGSAADGLLCAPDGSFARSARRGCHTRRNGRGEVPLPARPLPLFREQRPQRIRWRGRSRQFPARCKERCTHVLRPRGGHRARRAAPDS